MLQALIYKAEAKVILSHSRGHIIRVTGQITYLDFQKNKASSDSTKYLIILNDNYVADAAVSFVLINIPIGNLWPGSHCCVLLL